jgi:hypothetical protein
MPKVHQRAVVGSVVAMLVLVVAPGVGAADCVPRKRPFDGTCSDPLDRGRAGSAFIRIDGCEPPLLSPPQARELSNLFLAQDPIPRIGTLETVLIPFEDLNEGQHPDPHAGDRPDPVRGSQGGPASRPARPQSARGGVRAGRDPRSDEGEDRLLAGGHRGARLPGRARRPALPEDRRDRRYHDLLPALHRRHHRQRRRHDDPPAERRLPLHVRRRHSVRRPMGAASALDRDASILSAVPGSGADDQRAHRLPASRVLLRLAEQSSQEIGPARPSLARGRRVVSSPRDARWRARAGASWVLQLTIPSLVWARCRVGGIAG